MKKSAWQTEFVLPFRGTVSRGLGHSQCIKQLLTEGSGQNALLCPETASGEGPVWSCPEHQREGWTVHSVCRGTWDPPSSWLLLGQSRQQASPKAEVLGCLVSRERTLGTPLRPRRDESAQGHTGLWKHRAHQSCRVGCAQRAGKGHTPPHCLAHNTRSQGLPGPQAASHRGVFTASLSDLPCVSPKPQPAGMDGLGRGLTFPPLCFLSRCLDHPRGGQDPPA